jgi:hypothetical protein
MIDEEEVLRVCAQERVIPAYKPEAVFFVTDKMLRERLEAFTYGTDRDDKQEVSFEPYNISFGPGF